MPLHCIKTGCTAYLDPYGEVVHGDLFAYVDPRGESLNLPVIMRVCERDIGGSFAHAFISTIDLWWDERDTDLPNHGMPHNSTLAGTMTRFNYNGL